MPAHSSVAKIRRGMPYRRLATNGGEKCRLAVLISSIASADLAIIAHPDYDGGELNEDILRKLFLRENIAFPSGHTAIPANHAIGS